MTILIRDVRAHELDAVLALNNAAGPTILPLDAARLRQLHDTADYFRVAEVDGHIAGFLVGFSQAADHDSSNFRWFKQRFDAFLYIDRVVVAGSRRGAGVGRVFYADLQSFAEVRWPQIACEVFLDEGSDPALLFHGTLGFQEAGQHVMAESGKRCSMLVRPLRSHPWVREHYLLGEGLPAEPWLAARRIDDAGARADGRATGT
ncbi:MAG: GNAT family N-acetyltransferase [Lysobacteraceae bacterium]